MSRPKRIGLALEVFHNGFAPPGWCEIQRDDNCDDERLLELPAGCGDDAAAARVVEYAGMPGTAARYSRELGVLVLLDADGCTGAPSDAYEAIDAMAAKAGGLPRWIAIVPASAAYAAGLIGRKQERDALKGWT